MDVKELLLQIAIGERDAKTLTTDEMAELYKHVEEGRLEKLGILDECKKAHLDREEKEHLREDRLKKALSLIEEVQNILSIYDLELRVTKAGTKFVDRTGKVSNLGGSTDLVKRLGRGKKTHISAYYLPILKSIEELGGEARSYLVLDSVKEKMEKNFTEFDLEVISSGTAIRWRNTANWAKFKLKDKGYLSSDSPQGVWEITEKGREYIRDHSENDA
jgi:hypothetical protein